MKELDSTPTGASSGETEDKQCLRTIWHKQKCIQIYIWSKMANNCEQRLRTLDIDAKHLSVCESLWWKSIVVMGVLGFFAVMLHVVNWDLLWEKATARKSLCNYDSAP